MGTKVGPLLALVGVAGVLVFGAPAGASPGDGGDTTEVPPATEPAPATTEPTPPPSAVTDGAPIQDRGPLDDLSKPVRPGSTFQTHEPPPPPPTTTTTTVPPWGALPANSGTGRRAVYSKTQQRVWAVDEAGNVIKTHLVSGRQVWCDPRPGTYSVWSRSRYTFALQNPSVTWGYMVRFAKGCRGGNIGFHEIPYQHGRPVQSISQLGTPLSGGCVRQSVPDAIWMWDWAQLGTKVVVLP